MICPGDSRQKYSNYADFIMDGIMDRQKFPKVKNVVTKWTKNGQRYLLHDRDLSGKDIYITIPISDTDTEKDYFKKIADAKRKLNDKKIGSSIYSVLNEYFDTKQYAENTRIGQRFLGSFCFNDKVNRDLVNELLTRDLKLQTKRMRLRQISNFFEWLQMYKKINVVDPALGVTIKCQVVKRSRCVTNGELTKLFTMFKNPEYELAVRLAFFTGARISSIHFLTPESLVNGYLHYDNVKCKKRYDYVIPLRDEKTLSLYQTVAAKGYMWSVSLRTMKGYINRHMRDTFGKDINGEYLTIHSLRHSFATRAIQNGVPPEIVSKMLDHSSISTTLTYYAKHSQKQIDDAMDKIFEK